MYLIKLSTLLIIWEGLKIVSEVGGRDFLEIYISLRTPDKYLILC